MVPDLIRDAPFGRLVNYVSDGRFFPYPDQRPGYVFSASDVPSYTSTCVGDSACKLTIPNIGSNTGTYVVDWDGPEDPENPQ